MARFQACAKSFTSKQGSFQKKRSRLAKAGKFTALVEAEIGALNKEDFCKTLGIIYKEAAAKSFTDKRGSLRKKRSRLEKAGRSTEIVDEDVSAFSKEDFCADVCNTFLRKQEAETIYKKHLQELQGQIRFLRKNNENPARLAKLNSNVTN
jgi:hypothetical protein